MTGTNETSIDGTKAICKIQSIWQEYQDSEYLIKHTVLRRVWFRCPNIKIESFILHVKRKYENNNTRLYLNILSPARKDTKAFRVPQNGHQEIS